MKITETNRVSFRLEIEVTALYSCDNCGKEYKLTETHDLNELYWVLQGAKYNAEKDCENCGDSLIVIPFKEGTKIEESKTLGEKAIEMPDIKLDISKYQE